MDHSGMDMGGMDMSNSTSNSTAASSSMDMGMGGASACKSESISLVLGPSSPSLPSRVVHVSLPPASILPRTFREHADPSLDALELVHCRHLLPLFHMAQQYQSQIRRISHWRLLPRNRHRGFEEIGKGLRSTYHSTSYGTPYCYEWRYDSYGRW
jgi:hypothetical protein